MLIAKSKNKFFLKPIFLMLIAKSRKFLLVEGKVKIADTYGNILETDKASYDKANEIIITHNNTKLILEDYNNSYFKLFKPELF